MKATWKIDAGALSDDDIKTCAWLIRQMVGEFSEVHGVPKGGLRLAKALERYQLPDSKCPLVIDDVLTTGASMAEMAEQIGSWPCRGAVIFARGKCPAWIRPLFQMPECLWSK